MSLSPDSPPSTPLAAPLLDVRGLTRRFGPILAVDQVSFSVGPGEVMGFLGPNGAGKSTTMKMITGFLAPSEGSAVVCGHDVELEPVAAKRHLGYLPEGGPLYADMTPASFLRFVAGVRGMRGPAARARVDAVMERLALGPVREQRIDTLSKGFKRRVGIAQAILHEPKVLILDEPTDGLDPNQKHEMRALIREMAADKAIVISTHILEEVEAVCTRAIVIAAGRVLVDDTPGALSSRSTQHNAVVIELAAADADRAVGVLQGLDGVAGIDRLAVGDALVRLFVKPRGPAPVLDEVLGALRAARVDIETIAVQRGRLEDVFRRITTPPEEKIDHEELELL